MIYSIVCVHVPTCGNQRPMLDVFLNTLHFMFESGSLPQPGAKMASHELQGSACLSPLPSPHNRDSTCKPTDPASY